jgi:hypothetical protein
MTSLAREVETLLRSQNALLAGAFTAAADVRQVDGADASRVRVRQALEDFVRSFESLDAFDTALHSAPIGFPRAAFEECETLLREQARIAVDAADALMRIAEDSGVPASTYTDLKQRRDEWHSAITWTDEDYASSPEFMGLFQDAVEEYEAGDTEEGGFGR